MTTTLKIPEPRLIRAGHSFPKIYALAHTEDQLKEFGRDVLEQAALECESQAETESMCSNTQAENAADACAIRIRAMKEQIK
tara:strand:- start:273 stop:518 length:246 start_codon:yes stop_codon:yes gene_type:complete